MHLLIDYREKNAVQPIIDQLPSSAYTLTNLHLGDFQFVIGSGNEQRPLMIIERKTINDLAASVKDGRYMEQKMRLLSKRQEEQEQDTNVKIAYILEGNYSFSPKFTCANMNNKSLSGAIINSILRDNVIVWSTKSMLETNDLLINLHGRLTKDPQKYFEEKIPCREEGEREGEGEGEGKNKNQNKNSHDLYTSTVIAGKLHGVKKDNLDVKMCMEVQLSCIPGLSSKKAHAIIKTLNLKSLYNLGSRLKEEEEFNEGKKKKKQEKREKRSILQSVDGIGQKLEDTIRTFVLGG